MNQLKTLINNDSYLSQVLSLDNLDDNPKLYRHLQRFLIAKQDDAERAYKKLLRYHKWFDQMKLDDYSVIEEEVNSGKIMLTPVKKNQKVVVIIRAGRHLADSKHHDRVMSLVTRCCFYLVKHAINNVVMIVDLQGFGYSNLDMGLPKRIGTFTTMYFPSYIDQLLFVNPGFLALTTWKIIKPLVPIKHLKRISFLEKYDQLNSNGINLEQLPKEYGGLWSISEAEWLTYTKEELKSVCKIRY